MSEAKVVWLSGNMHERKLTLEKIKGQFAGADVRSLDGDFSVAYMETVLRQESVFSERKLLIVHDIPKPTTTRQTMVNQLKKLLEDVPDECLVVFDGIPATDEKAISGHVAKIGKLFSFKDKLESHEAVAWLVSVFAEHGKEIEETEAQMLIEQSGHDKNVGGIGIDLLRLAVLKIVLYMARRKNVTVDDVQVNTFPSQDFVIWKIFDYLDAKDLVGCQNMFFRLCDEEHSVNTAINFLFNVAIPRYRLLLFLKEGLASNKSKQDVVKDALSLPKLAQTGQGWLVTMNQDVTDDGSPKFAFTEYAINGALNGQYGKAPTIDLYSRRDLVRISGALQEGMTELRARSQSDAALLVLADVFFLAACTKVDDIILRTMREPYGYV